MNSSLEANSAVARIGDYHHRGVQGLVQSGDEPADGDRIVRLELEGVGGRLGPRRQFPRRGLQTCGDQSLDEVAQQHAVVVVMADAQGFAGGVDRARGIEFGGEDAHVDVGQVLAQEDHAVAFLDEAGNLFAAHGALVDAGEQADGVR